MVNIQVYFLTPHKFPVKQAKVSIEFTNFKAGPLTPNEATGLLEYSANLTPDQYSNQGKFVLTIGPPDYQLVNTFTFQLDSNNSLKNTYYQFPTPYPKPTTVSACVLDRFNKPFPNAQATIIYDLPIFQDQLVVQTDAKTGCFSNTQDMQEYIPIGGNILLERKNYLPYDLRKNSVSYKNNGFYLLNDLKFNLDEKIILKNTCIPINIQGKILNEKGLPISSVSLKLEKFTQQNAVLKFYKKKKQSNPTFTLTATSDAAGNFSFQLPQSPFAIVDSSPSQVLSFTLSITNPQAYSQALTIKESDYFDTLPLTIKLTPKSNQAKVTGKVIDSQKKLALPNVQVVLDYKDKTNSYKVQGTTDATGAFALVFDAYLGTEYTGKVTLSLNNYKSVSVDIKPLNDANKFTTDIGTVSLLYSPNMQDVTIQGVIQEDLPDPQPVLLSNIKVSLKILSKLDNKLQQLNLVSDQKGAFSSIISLQEKLTYEVTLDIASSSFDPVTLKKDIVVSNTSNILDFSVIKLKRKVVKATISGEVVEYTSLKPLANAKISVLANPAPPKPPADCKSDAAGKFSCSFVVLAGITYTYQLQITSSIGQVATWQSPDSLSTNNLYQIQNQKVLAKFNDVKGLVKGVLIKKSTQKELENHEIIVVIQSPQQQIVRCPNKTNAKGEFSCEINLNEGPLYKFYFEIRSSINQKADYKDKSLILQPSNSYKIDNLNVQVDYQQEKATVKATFINAKTNSPVKGGKVQLDVKPQISTSSSTTQDCPNTNDQGEVLCEFQIDSGVSYRFTGVVTAQNTQKANFSGGDLNSKNKYTNDLSTVQLRFIGENIQGALSGGIYDEKGQKITDKSQYQIVSAVNVDDASERVSFNNYRIDIQNGDFVIKIDLTKGFSYKICLNFFSDKYIDSNKCFDLNLSNNYAQQNLKVTLQSPLTVEFSGKVLTLKRKAISSVNINLIFPSTKQQFNTVTDKNGQFLLSMQIKVFNVETLEAQLKASLEKFEDFSQTLTFEKGKNFKISDFEISMVSLDYDHSIQGVVVEKNQYAVRDVQITLVLKDSKKEQKIKTVSDKKGQFELDFKINQNEHYQGTIYFFHDFFYSNQFEFQLTSDNNYILGKQNYNLERKKILLTMHAKIINIFHQPLNRAIAKVIVAASNNAGEESNDEDGIIYINTFKTTISATSDEFGRVKIQEFVEVGFDYYCKTTVTISDDQYEEQFEQINFNYENSYLVKDDLIIMYRQKAQAKVSGKILFDKKPVQGAFVYLEINHFLNEVNFNGKSHILDKENFIQPMYTNSDGLFSFDFAKEYGYSYDISIKVQHPNYQDAIKDIQISSLNKYQSHDNQIELQQSKQTVKGTIKGLTLDDMNNVLPNCQISVYNQVYEDQKSSFTSNEKGEFLIEFDNLISKNQYLIKLEFQPAPQTENNVFFYRKGIQEVMLWDKNDYQVTDILLFTSRYHEQYYIEGKVQNLKKPKDQMYSSFYDQFNAQNSVCDVQQAEPTFKLTGRVSKGLDYKPEILIQTFKMQETITYEKNYLLKGLFIILADQSPLDQQDLNPYNFIGKIYTQTKCSLFPQMDISFVKISAYFGNNDNYRENIQNVNVSDVFGNFQVSLRKPFDDQEAFLLLQKDGFKDLKVHLKFGKEFETDLGQIALITYDNQPVNCTKEQQKIQEKYDNGKI